MNILKIILRSTASTSALEFLINYENKVDNDLII